VGCASRSRDGSTRDHDAARAATTRDRYAGRYTRYVLLDRGSYEFVVDPDEPELFARMRRAAEQATGRTLAVSSSRLVRLAPGDYLLAHHDRIYDDNPVEATLDLSPAPVPDAELHYRRRGQVFLRVACTPTTLAIVERGITITSNHCYVSKLHVDASVVRLSALLRDS
jgi:hypothetical protein